MRTQPNIRCLWDQKDDQKLKSLLRVRGIGLEKIAVELKRSEKAIRRRCERLKISSSNVYKKR